MVVPALLAVWLAAVLAGALGWRRLRAGLGGLALVAMFAVGCGPVPNLLLCGWQAPFAQRPALDWAPSNAIVLLTATSNNPPGGTAEPSVVGYTRVAETASLYRACRAAGARCTVLVTGGETPTADRPLALAYAEALARLGVPKADLLLEPRSRTTWQNAEFSQPILARLAAQRVWLVSSALHLRRGMFAFRQFGIAATPVRADYTRVVWSLLPSAKNLAMTNAALHEYAGLALYHWFAWRMHRH